MPEPTRTALRFPHADQTSCGEILEVYCEALLDPEGEGAGGVIAAVAELERQIGCSLAAGARGRRDLIAVDAFEAFARDLAREASTVGDADTWPANCIDWNAAALMLRSNLGYERVVVEGRGYWSAGAG